MICLFYVCYFEVSLFAFFKRLIDSGCWKFGHSSAVLGKKTVVARNLGIAPPYLVNVLGFIGLNCRRV